MRHIAWNMGQGMLLITPQPEAVMTIARQHGIPAQVIGEVTSSLAYGCAVAAILARLALLAPATTYSFTRCSNAYMRRASF